jgi:hypothetical protein
MPKVSMQAQRFGQKSECSFLEFLAPGRRAGYHVDWIVMHAQRVVDLLNATPPNVETAANAARRICAELGVSNMLLAPRMFFGGARVAGGLISSGVMDAMKSVGNIAGHLQCVLAQQPVDLPAVRVEAARLLDAAQNLQRRADAFENRTGAT